MDIELWKEKAIGAIGKMPDSKVCVLKDLFDGVEWKMLSKGERIGFGKIFKNEVIEGNIPGLKVYGKASNNSTRYIKVKEN